MNRKWHLGVYQDVVVFVLPACLRSCRQSELRCWRTAWQETGPAHPARHHQPLSCKAQTSWPPDRRSHRSEKSDKTCRLALITSCTRKCKLKLTIYTNWLMKAGCCQQYQDTIDYEEYQTVFMIFSVFMSVSCQILQCGVSSPWCRLRSGRAQWRWSLTLIQATQHPSESTLMEGNNLSSERTRLQSVLTSTHNSLEQIRCCF